MAVQAEPAAELSALDSDAPEFDLTDAERFVAGVPHDAFTWLRQNAPVYWHEEAEGTGFWVFTKYDDLCYASKNPQLFSSYRGGTNIEDYPKQDLSMIRLMMVNMDPPQHGKYRKLVRRGFTPKMVSRLEPKIRQTAKELVDRIAAKGECEFITEIAGELPLLVIADLMGIPQEDRHQIFNWTNTLIGFSDPEFSVTFDEVKGAAAQMWGYANTLASRREDQDPDGSIVSLLMSADVDGAGLSVMEFDAFFLLLAVAGNETTRNLVAGAMQALIENPDQRQKLLDDPSLIPTAVEEFLRWVTPVMYFRRTATQDMEVRGVSIKENDKIAMYHSSANRDEDYFDNPQVFDVTRDPNPHVAFGVGEHFCLGASLARLEIVAIFEELLSRLPDMELAAPPRRLQSNFINGIKEMRLKFTPEQ